MDIGVLEKIDLIIRQLARKYLKKIDDYDYEDLVRGGRIVAWQFVVDRKIGNDNFGTYVKNIRKLIVDYYDEEYEIFKARRRLRLASALNFDIDDETINLYGDKKLSPLHEIVSDQINEITIEGLDSKRHIATKSKDHKSIKDVIYCLVMLLGIKPEEIPKKVNYQTFVDYGLQYYLWIFFSNSPYQALRCAFSNLNPEDMKKVSNKYWVGENGKERAVEILKKALLESSYLMSEYPLIINEKFIQNIGLSTPYQKHFHSSPFAFLDAVFPEVFKPWEMARTPAKYFKEDEELVKKAMRWLVEDKLAIPLPDMDEKEVWRQGISKKITKDVMEDYGLRGLLAIYGNYPEPLMRLTYPGKFQAWDFKHKAKWQGPEGLELAARATRWVIEDYAGLSPTSAGIGYRFFVENGLHGMITSKSLGFNSSPKAALKNAYPNLLIP